MRIGFTGAQGTGKTTLLRQMVGWPELNGHVFISGMVRGVSKANGTPINQQGTFEGQKMLVKTLCHRLKNESNFVTDRTLLDMYAYTRWSKEKGEITVQQLNYIRTQIRTYQHLFDIVFYIRPEFPIQADGIRSDDQGYALAIAAEMEHAVKYEPLGTKQIVVLTGSVEERLLSVRDAVQDYLREK